MTQELDTKEILFLEYLFDGEGMRHPTEAKVMAGYAADYPLLKIMKRVKTELIDRMDAAITMHAPKALLALLDLMNEPETPGNKLKKEIALDLLDRGGVVKKEKAEVAPVAPSYVFVLPQKQEIKEN